MTNSSTIPVMKQPVSKLETGANGGNLSSEAAALHPVDSLQRQTGGMHPYRNHSFARHVYGSGLAMVLATEQKLAEQEHQQQRMTGLHRGGLSSGVFGDIVTGQDLTIDFTDYLSMSINQPDAPKHNPHLAMERSLGM
jgi:Proteasome maturation factor UMP1